MPRIAVLACICCVSLLALLTAADHAEAAGLPAWKQALQPRSDAWKAHPQVLRFNNGTDPHTLDPAYMQDVAAGNVARALFEGLCVSDPKTLEPRPGGC